ncbi:hypothetical protein ACFLSJ_02525 [Verrucomicrobiota bacterium]
MKENKGFDFWYAVNNTEVVLMPARHLETFGTTVLHYHLVSELMDTVGQTRVREGRMHSSQPKIVTPEAYSKTFLEGFGEEARRYVEWLKEHEKDIRILQYGYKLSQESFNEHVVTDTVQTVVEQVKTQVKAKGDPLSAVVLGVDDPWDVCLIKLFWEIIQNSAKTNIRQLARHHMFDQAGGVPRGVRDEIESAFLAASRNPALIGELGQRLQTYGLFEEYQDRFFSLVKTTKQ